MNILTLLTIFASIFILVCIRLSNMIIRPVRTTYEESYKHEAEAGRLIKENFDTLVKEEIYINSPFGYKIYALFFPVKGAKKTIIICHGYTWTHIGAVKYMSMFLKMNFNVLIYDHRNHGRSGGNFTTFGLYEKYDLKACTDWVLKRCGSDCIVGTMGESMGAAVVLQNAAIDSRIAFCIADCPYSDLIGLFKIRLKEDYHLPPFPLLYLVSFITRIRTGIRFRDVSPIKDIEKIIIPVLFTHGKNDHFIPDKMSISMYNIKAGLKRLYLAPDAGHVESYWHNKEEYEKQVLDFLVEIGILAGSPATVDEYENVNLSNDELGQLT